jgi:hypothetical protein
MSKHQHGMARFERNGHRLHQSESGHRDAPFWTLSADTTATGSFTQVVGPNPGVASDARSARIILVRDHEAELLSTLSTAVSSGMSIGSVVTTLAKFFA